MPTSRQFASYVADQLSGAGTIRCRPLMGEYGLWRDGIFFGTIEDDRFCLKITQAGHALAPNAPEITPRPGAHFLYIEDLEDRTFLARLVQATCAQLPPPRPRRPRRNPSPRSDQ